METLQGRAEQVRHTVHMSGHGLNRHRSVHSTHICLLTVQGKAVVIRTHHPIAINDGDQLILAGTTKHGSLHALAHHNLSNGAHSHDGIWSHLVAGPVLVAISVYLGLSLNGAHINGFPFHWLISGAFLAAGVFAVLKGVRIKQAATLVTQAIR
ncbi:MAG: hypothetical protein U0998_10370 [Moraxellaceae bacterium]|nr:hypothetical protein [Moraxellaceae bacterium]MDZ4387578.1 hypothetical protein [Moraxellaceae bacterium]